ncbi:transposase [Streptococcus equi subsp. equi]|uniref:Transposase n=1 Tax=Streptococcus equi subsp. equi TaxID=148942 RepID=A0A380KQH4_9STRE|nr:transposase [Streptococcus equi subsp. equi]
MIYRGIKLPASLKRIVIFKRWIKRFNKQFGGLASESVFEKAPKPAQRNLLLARISERVIDSGHHIRYQNNFYLPVEGVKEIYFTRKTKALVIEAFDGDIYLNIADNIYATRKLPKTREALQRI